MVERGNGSPVDTDPLLAEIESVIRQADVSATRFGYFAAGDPTLLPKMRRGRRIVKRELREAIVAEIAKLKRVAAERALS